MENRGLFVCMLASSDLPEMNQTSASKLFSLEMEHAGRPPYSNQTFPTIYFSYEHNFLPFVPRNFLF